VTSGGTDLPEARDGGSPLGVASSDGLAITLRRGRARCGMSLSEASEAAGISRAHLHELEAGRSTNPTIAVVASLWSLYGLTAEELWACVARTTTRLTPTPRSGCGT
jgi:DNA-binding XRE family transcriptional regulator